MSCKLCRMEEVVRGQGENTMLINQVGNLYVEIQSEDSREFVGEEFAINYCPLCGRNLEVEQSYGFALDDKTEVVE